MKNKIEELIKGLKHAKDILDFTGGGDSYERECTEDERNEFYKICEKYNIK